MRRFVGMSSGEFSFIFICPGTCFFHHLLCRMCNFGSPTGPNFQRLCLCRRPGSLLGWEEGITIREPSLPITRQTSLSPGQTSTEYWGKGAEKAEIWIPVHYLREIGEWRLKMIQLVLTWEARHVKQHSMDFLRKLRGWWVKLKIQ